ncbi:DUF4352 domain-containing protein [Streptosporangium longisporum]|uniref:DUF4352 domain-containing protein n=1 Tax=Streptosporangium longisporum TaxID=46187 RepID=A0ABP6L2Z5_9ACTN
MTYPPQGPQPRPGHQHPQPPQQQPYGHVQGPPHGYPPPYGHPGYGGHQPPPPPSSSKGFLIGIITAVSLTVVAAVIGTIVLVSSTTSGDSQLRTAPDTGQRFLAPPPTEAGQPADAGQSLADPPAEQQGQVAKVGETITVKGMKPGVEVAVTLNRVIDNATSTNQYLQPDPGTRYVAVELTLKNMGQQVYTDSPIMGADLIDTEGQQHRTTLMSDVKEGVPFSGSITVSPGDSRKGLIVFKVPTNAKPAKLQFGVMLSRDKGEWTLS